jgi:hypothetical protein
MTSRTPFLLAIALVLTLGLAACAEEEKGAASPTATAARTATPAATKTPQATPTPVPTRTPEATPMPLPSTPTPPLPTPTPEPATPTPLPVTPTLPPTLELPTPMPVPPTPTPVGSYKIGDVATITPYADTRFSLTFLWWKESPIAVDGPYSGGDYYTFTARPDMKFVILAFRFRNDWKSPLETPSLAGTVITDRGYEFPAWSPPLGVHSEEYGPRLSTQEELQALPGNAAAYEELLPEQESGQGALVFEVPVDRSPASVQLSYVDRPVLLGE